jgi:hypothetical protein
MKRVEKLKLIAPKSIPDKPTRAKRPWFREAVPREKPRKLDIKEGRNAKGARPVSSKVKIAKRLPVGNVVMW